MEYTADEVRELLWRRMKAKHGAPMTQTTLAAQIGVSTPFLNDFLLGKREPQGKVLEFLNLERAVTYRYRKKK